MDSLLPDGFRLLLIGQLTVLSFLACIVFTIKLITWLCRRFAPSPATVEASSIPPAAMPAAADGEEEAAVAAAIAAAIHHNRRD